jgi:hypothetical protein
LKFEPSGHAYQFPSKENLSYDNPIIGVHHDYFIHFRFATLDGKRDRYPGSKVPFKRTEMSPSE